MRFLTWPWLCLIPYALAHIPTEQLLSEGTALLANRQFNDALSRFDDAIRQDPKHYLSYFRRATVYLSLGRHGAAIEDFTRILDLKPDFDQAYLQRAQLHAKQGHFDDAKDDLQNYLSKRPSDEDASNLVAMVEKAIQHSSSAEHDQAAGNEEGCISHLSEAIQIAPRSTALRRARARCHLVRGEIEEAVGDLVHVAQLMPSDPTLLLQLAKIHFYALYEPQGALSHVKQCLHHDPEQKQCKAVFREIKRIEKQLVKVATDVEQERLATALKQLVGTASSPGLITDAKEQIGALETELDVLALPKRLLVKCYETVCSIYAKQKDDAKTDQWCSTTLELAEDHVEALLHRGQAKMNTYDYEAAVQDFEKAKAASDNDQGRIESLLQRARQMLRQSKRRDYYKILDVARDADTRDIKKAYRKSAYDWHPDRYSGDLSKEEVENKMAEINQAYEVLSDPEKREQYDHGYDPYDPEAQQQQAGHHPFGGGHPFAHQFQGGFPFGGNGQGFHFKMQF